MKPELHSWHNRAVALRPWIRTLSKQTLIQDNPSFRRLKDHRRALVLRAMLSSSSAEWQPKSGPKSGPHSRTDTMDRSGPISSLSFTPPSNSLDFILEVIPSTAKMQFLQCRPKQTHGIKCMPPDAVYMHFRCCCSNIPLLCQGAVPAAFNCICSEAACMPWYMSPRTSSSLPSGLFITNGRI